MKSIIGILPMINGENQSYIVQNYINAIEYAGGTAILLPYTENEESIAQFAKMCDGFIFAGGPDIEPWRYGEEKLDVCESTVPPRDSIELLAFPKIFATGKPTLGICRGLQMLNVALGGTLYQDIPAQYNSSIIHRNPEEPPIHSINIVKDSPLYEHFNSDKATVNSYHHQAIKKLGDGLEVMARADDGIIEAAYMPKRRFFWMLQWHPERNMNDILSQIIFREFIKATR